MRQKLISVCIVTIMVFSIYGCTQTEEDVLVVPKVCNGKLGTSSTKSAEQQEEQSADVPVTREEAEPEKEIDFDGSDIHLSILTEYERAWEDETYTVEQWQDVAGVFMTLTDAKWLGWSTGNYTLYYSISDLSGDGTEELIIGIRGGDGIAPCFLYTGDGERIHMTDSRTGSDLVGQPTILYEKGIVESREYIKYGMYRYNFYQLPKDAGEMKLIDCYFYFYIEDLENGTQYYRGDMDNTIAEEEFWNGIKDYESMPQIELDWHELDGFWEPDEDGAKTTVIGEEYRQSGIVAESEGKAESKEDESVTVIPKVTQYYPDGSILCWEECEYDSIANRIKMTMYWPDGSVRSWYESEYDSAGNLIRKTGYNDNGTDYRVECKYDHAGNLVEHISYDSDDSIKYWSKHEYDDAGNQTKCTSYNSDGSIYCSWENEYDSVGNQTRRVDYDCDGRLYSWEQYQYDDLGNQIKQVGYDADVSLDWWHEYEYDNVGNQTKDIAYDNNGDILRWYEWEYDSMGNLMRERKYYTGVDKSLSSENVYEYEYDDDGNRIKELMYRSDGGIEHYYEYDSAGNRTKLVLYRNDGSIFEWDEYEYVTITPQ